LLPSNHFIISWRCGAPILNEKGVGLRSFYNSLSESSRTEGFEPRLDRIISRKLIRMLMLMRACQWMVLVPQSVDYVILSRQYFFVFLSLKESRVEKSIIKLHFRCIRECNLEVAALVLEWVTLSNRPKMLVSLLQAVFK